jgi:hypothetical protein
VIVEIICCCSVEWWSVQKKNVPREVHFFSGRFVREQTDDFTSETELVVRSKHPKVERNGKTPANGRNRPFYRYPDAP